MEPHPLKAVTENFIREHGVPQILDVEHSIQVHKPTLTGSDSPASYYIRPPDGMTADAFVDWFESLPNSREYRLTLVPILGLDTFHQPLISTDDFAMKYFHDNHARIVRVVGKSTQAIEAITAIIEALKLPFDARHFPHHDEFAVSGYKAQPTGGATELKLLFKPADHSQLMKVERLVNIHLEECNLGREIGVTRHATRDQAPELIFNSTHDAVAGVTFLLDLKNSLPQASPEEIAQITLTAKSSHAQPVSAPTTQTPFTQPQAVTRVIPPDQLMKNVVSVLAEFLKGSKFGDGLEVKIVQAGTTIEVKFPRTASSLWLKSSFNESKHLRELSQACVGVKTDPVLREGWKVVYHFDPSTGNLHIRAISTQSEPPKDWKAVAR